MPTEPHHHQFHFRIDHWKSHVKSLKVILLSLYDSKSFVFFPGKKIYRPTGFFLIVGISGRKRQRFPLYSNKDVWMETWRDAKKMFSILSTFSQDRNGHNLTIRHPLLAVALCARTPISVKRSLLKKSQQNTFNLRMDFLMS